MLHGTRRSRTTARTPNPSATWFRGFPFACLLGMASCAQPIAPPPAPIGPTEASRPHRLPTAELSTSTLVESPVSETTLAGSRSTADAWLSLIQGATREIRLAFFYASDAPPSALTPVIEALGERGRHGVAIRILIDPMLATHYAKTLETLRAIPGATVRMFRGKTAWGGILHAKYMVLDDQHAFVGSQNFDYRALTHIQELGVETSQRDVVVELGRLFDVDWAIADGRPAEHACAPTATAPSPRTTTAAVPNNNALTLVVSPSRCTLGHTSEMHALGELVDRSVRSLDLQLLYYESTPGLTERLRAAGARGVRIRVLLSTWALQKKYLEYTRALSQLPGVELKIMRVPEHSSGFIPYARLVHAKILQSDGAAFYLGTSNWAPEYFAESRNVGLVGDSGEVPRGVHAFFERNWTSPYATPFAPNTPSEEMRREAP